MTDDELIASMQGKETKPACAVPGCTSLATSWPCLELRAREKDRPVLAVLRANLCPVHCLPDPHQYITPDFWTRMLGYFDAKKRRRPKLYKTRLRYVSIGSPPNEAIG